MFPPLIIRETCYTSTLVKNINVNRGNIPEFLRGRDKVSYDQFKLRLPVESDPPAFKPEAPGRPVRSLRSLCESQHHTPNTRDVLSGSQPGLQRFFA